MNSRARIAEGASADFGLVHGDPRAHYPKFFAANSQFISLSSTPDT